MYSRSGHRTYTRVWWLGRFWSGPNFLGQMHVFFGFLVFDDGINMSKRRFPGGMVFRIR